MIFLKETYYEDEDKLKIGILKEYQPSNACHILWAQPNTPTNLNSIICSDFISRKQIWQIPPTQTDMPLFLGLK